MPVGVCLRSYYQVPSLISLIQHSSPRAGTSWHTAGRRSPGPPRPGGPPRASWPSMNSQPGRGPAGSAQGPMHRGARGFRLARGFHWQSRCCGVVSQAEAIY
jgi:hypothetical protein